MEDIMQILRSSGASINMDFLFGLPLQTADSFLHTIEKAAELHPDRVTTSVMVIVRGYLSGK